MSRKLILASTIAVVLAGTDVSALGLGGLRTQSALNQPFLGQIELRDIKADEIDSVSAVIASQDAFNKAGVERYYYLTRLIFTPEITQQGKAVIRVSSKDPIREPYMDFLVSVVWPTGRLVKEYTVLLDPPSLTEQSAPMVRSARAESVASGSRTVAAQAAGIGRANAYIPAPGDGFPLYAGPVANGMGLWTLARDKSPAGATVAQTAMAFYRNNQNAFIRGNINRLIAGKTLVIPSRAELFALDAEAAQREYLAGLRGRAQYREPITDVAATETSRLQLSGASESRSGAAVQTPTPTVQRDLMLALETSESTRQEALELRDRVKELESQLADIQDLLQLRNAELARIQEVRSVPGSLSEQPQIALETPQDVQSTEPGPTLESVPMPLDEFADTDQSVAIETPESIDPSMLQDMASLDAALAEDETALTEETVALADETAEAGPALIPVPVPTPVAIEIEDVDEAPAVVAEKPTETLASETPDTAEPNSTWHSLLLPLAGLAGVTALGILIFSWITRRRRREEEAFEDYEGDLDDDLYDTLDAPTEPRPSRLVENDPTTVEATAPKADDQPLTKSPSPHTSEGDSGLTMMSSLSNFDAETDEADILSEADIYIAYGRHSEAQDLLKAELQRFPERLDIKFKLAESFAAAKDLDALNALMEEIESAGGHALEPVSWAKLQSQREQLRMGGGVPAFGAAVAATAAAVNSEDVQPADSLDLGSDDALSLDISDFQRKSSQPQGAASAGGLDLGKDATLPDDRGFERDSFGDAMTVAVQHDLLDLDEPRRDADSEIEMVLEEHKVEDIDDLDSIFDTNTVDEPTLARNEISGARPTDIDVSNTLASGILDSSETGLPPDQESVPSDLLSSQWQIDSGIWDETATKLDLARAYIEMDDKDAAREILEEVVAEGRDEQRAEAKALLENLT